VINQQQKPEWPDCVDDGYFVNGCLNPGYVVRERMEVWAKAMADEGLTTHQVRRFFQHCRAIEARLRAKTSTWECEVAEFNKLDVAVADAFGKSPPKVREIFHGFIRRNVQAVKTQEDFLEGFLPHFEALVGFGTAYFRNERN
jgi:CRISPR type III-A-associated protein Csm2